MSEMQVQESHPIPSNISNNVPSFLQNLMDNKSNTPSITPIDEEINFPGSEYFDDPMELYRKNKTLFACLGKVVKHFFALQHRRFHLNVSLVMLVKFPQTYETDWIPIMLLLIRDNFKKYNMMLIF